MMMKKMNLLLVLLLIFSVAKAQDIETAYKQLSYGKDADAVSTVKAVINANPESFTDKFSLYSILSAAGKYSEATEVLNTIKAADEKGAYGKTADVLLRLEQGANPDDLVVDIDKAIRKGKKAKGFLYRTVGEYFLFGKKPNAVKAIGYIKAAIDDYGLKTYSTRLLLGDAYLLKNDAGNAVTNYEYALDLDKTNAVPHYKIGVTYIRAKRYEFGVPN
jgi:tetratricopeptide (TPR) repeat protein